MTKKRGWIVWVAVALSVIEICSLLSYGAYALFKPKECKHDWSEGNMTIEATCDVEGELTFTCTKCDEIRVEVVPMLEHQLEKYAARAPTCTSVGWDAYEKCSMCNYSTKEEKKSLGHAMVQASPGVEATCGNPGKTATMKCTRCGHEEGGKITTVAHKWEIANLKDFGVTPTCTQSGKNVLQTCENCGEKQGGETVPALGHKYKDGVCTRCGISE